MFKILVLEDDVMIASGLTYAFEEGAEDYVVKPFKIRELLARVGRTLITFYSSYYCCNVFCN